MLSIEEKMRLYHSIYSEKDKLISLLSSLIKIPSDNPPGNTMDIANFVREYLEDRGFEQKLYEPNRGNVNVVASWGKGIPHLILNGHLDQLPAEVGKA